MRYLTCITLFLLCITAQAQYNNPYRMAYDGTSYYITNKGNGTVTKLTSGTTNTVITGLSSPNDIFYGAVAGNTVLMLLDSNIIKIYDSATLASVLTVPINNAVEAHDGVFNPANSNEFFISDRAGNKIIKGSIGAAPFYPVTFSTFVANITKPAGMIVNNQGKLIVVSDSIGAKVYEINPSTASISTVLTTSLSNFNDVAQDYEGNYYITCWGNSNLYRYSSTWTTPTVVSTFNHPSGLYANINDDILGVTCTNCQKVEFKFFHLFSPASDVTACTADSFYATFVPTYQGIGTYNSGNNFLVEMSDSTGNFTNYSVIGSFSSTTPPTSILAALPPGKYAASGYKYRLASTYPVVKSYFTKDLTIKPDPIVGFVQGDSISGCTSSSLTLKAHYKPGYTYSWFPQIGYTASDSNTFTFSFANKGPYNYFLQVEDSISGCTSGKITYFSIQDRLTLTSLKKNKNACEGIPITIGVNQVPYIFSWSSSVQLSDTTAANPLYSSLSSSTLFVSYSDSAMTCFGNDTVQVTVIPKIPSTLLSDSVSLCLGDSVAIGLATSTHLFAWYGTTSLTSTSSTNPLYFGDTSLLIHVSISDSTETCSHIDSVNVTVNDLPDISLWEDSLNFCYGDSSQIGGISILNTSYLWEGDFKLALSEITHNSPRYYNNQNTAFSCYLFDTISGCHTTFNQLVNVYPEPDKPFLIDAYGSVNLSKHYGGTYKWIFFDYYINKDTFVITDTNSLSMDYFNYSNSITVEVTDSNGCISISDKFYLIRESIDEISLSFNIIPNPSNGHFNIFTDLPFYQITMHSMDGKVYYDERIATTSSHELITNVPRGIYLLEIEGDFGIVRKRVVVQ